ncbi:MAG: HD domain-containing protein [Lachnospiraceae bacterium]|nr:HD domain-containing protein [Lachnospiraceae bacterium]
MIYTELTNRALRLAYKAHEGQYDRAGIPYVFHPLHMAEQMTDETATCVALLHDVVEDTQMSMEELAEEFPEEVIEALHLLTREPGTDYYDYIRNLSGNPVAKAVKLADLAHNSDETRFAGCDYIPEEQLERWRRKYSKAKVILGEE